MPDPALVTAYEAATLAVTFPSGIATFDRTGQRTGEPITSPFGAITAWNPSGKPRSLQENEAAQSELAADIEAARWQGYPAVSYDPSGAHREPQFAIIGAPAAELLALARKYRQAAHFWWDGLSLTIVWCD